LKSHSAFLQRDEPPPGVPPVRSLLEFGFAARPAPLSQDSGVIILTRNAKDVSRWLSFLRSEGGPGVEGPDGAVIAWNHRPGHRVTRRIVNACIRSG
jgi:hypothetical protein